MNLRVLISAVGLGLSCGIAIGAPPPAVFQGFNVNFSALPAQARALIAAGINAQNFELRLEAGGTVVLDGQDTVINAVSPTQKSLAYLAVDRLELRHGARIITNGNTLVIFTNTLVSDNGRVLAYDTAQLKAPNGATANGVGGSGNPGDTGGGGGLVSIHVIQGVQGQLQVNLSGQAGGDGSAGNTGGPGAPGSRGSDAQDGPGGWLTPGWCKGGGQNGSQGAPGLIGGSGGSGGAGGDGGIFEFYNVGQAPIPDADYNFVSAGGQGGNNGSGGGGGPGGPGGAGGSGSTWCSGGHAGPQGPTGPVGYTVPTPAHNGVNGQAVVKALTLDVIINDAAAPSTPRLNQALKLNHALIQ